jgi:hypothetical protein
MVGYFQAYVYITRWMAMILMFVHVCLMCDLGMCN